MWKKVNPNYKMFHGSAGSCQVIDKVHQDNVLRTKLVRKSLNSHYKELSDVKNFSLEAQLKAGVKLQEVNSNVLSSELPESVLNNNEVVNPETIEQE